LFSDVCNNYIGFYVTNHFTGGVDLDGNILGFPPIHIHHVHCSPGVHNVYRQKYLECLLQKKYNCSHSFSVIFEQHGDYQCLPEDGGTGCYLEDLPSDYAKLVTGPLQINGELNDVRPPNSPEMGWYYQTAIKYIPKSIADKKKASKYNPMSFHYVWSPGRLDLSDQSTMVNTFLAPTDKDTFIWYTVRYYKELFMNI
jgi:hypothetical protein